MDISEQKKLARTEAYARRKTAHDRAPDAGQTAAVSALEFVGTLGAESVVSAYLPMRTEIDPRPAMLALHGRGHRICLPVIDGPALPLKFRHWTPGCPLQAGPFGAPVPVGGDWLVPDVLLVPLLAFDLRLYRLGYGGGYYDRTLAWLRRQRPVAAAGFAYAGQQVIGVPVDEFDQQLDAVITEAGIVKG